MVTILQKVTTFPLEMIDKTILTFLDISGQDIQNYYIKPSGTHPNGPVKDYTQFKTSSKEDKLLFKKKMIVYDALYTKLFENSLNMLEQTIKENTIIVFPTKEQNDKGRSDLNPKVREFYYNKFNDIKSSITFTGQKYCYLELPVFNNQKKDDYKNTIKYNFDKIRKLILDYNAEIANQKRYPKPISVGVPGPIGVPGPVGGTGEPVQYVIFILDIDKKGIFTGLYTKQLSKEKKDIVNKEYSSFLSNQGFRPNPVNDSTINITFSDIVKQARYFKQEKTIGISIGEDVITKEIFEKHILKLKNSYKKIIDKEYKKSLDLNDNISKFRVFYKIDNADKILEEKIETGPNKLYYIYKDEIGVNVKDLSGNKLVNKVDSSGKPVKKHADVIGYFTLTSAERGIYRFREDNSQYKNRITAEKFYNNKDVVVANSSNSGENVIDDEAENKDEEEEEEIESDGTLPIYDFAVKIKYQFGLFQYKNLDKSNIKKKHEKSKVNVENGQIKKFIDKLQTTYKWFNLRDIDLSFLNKEEIKYYSDILFDKKSLIEYLKSKQKYTDKTILSYEFLKINDSPELNEYCDFIHKSFKSNIKDGDSINPFKFTFNDDVIIKSIMDIIFQINTPIYLRESGVTKETARKETSDSYKILEYKIQNVNKDNAKSFFEKDKDTCSSESTSKYNCYNKYIDQDSTSGTVPGTIPDPSKIAIKKVIKIVVTKTNIKDVGLLKKTVGCKTKKEKLIYDYKKLFANVTQRIAKQVGFGIYGGGLSRKRRLKAKRYK